MENLPVMCVNGVSYHMSHVCMYVFMAITYSKSKDQLGKAANPARGQLNREK